MSEELTFQEKASLPACIQCDGYREDFPWEKTSGVVIAPDESYISFSSTASRLDYFLFNSKDTPDPGTDDCEVIAELSYAGLASGSYGRFINRHQIDLGDFSLGVLGSAGFLADSRYDSANGIQAGTVPKNTRFTYRFRKTGDLSEFWINSTKIRQHSTANRVSSAANWCLGGYLSTNGKPVPSVGNGGVIMTLYNLSIKFT